MVYNYEMLTFRLKYLFCLVLVIGVVLMWWNWSSSYELTANRLLEVREKLRSKELPTAEFRGTSRPPPIPIAEAFELLDTAGIPDKYTATLKSTLGETINFFDAYYVDLWMEDCRLVLKGYRVESQPTYTDFGFELQADWPAIEAKAHEENWTFYRQVIISIATALTIGWVVMTGKMRS